MIETRTLSVSDNGRLGTLYERHAPEAMRFAYLLTGDGALAEDLVHDAFLRMFGRFRDLRNPDAFHWYLRKTVVNLARSHFRHVKVEREYVAREAGRPVPRPNDGDLGERDAMRAALAVLSARQRAAIVLRYYEDLTEAQTAEVLGCRIGTVKSLVARGRERLREELRRDA
jgi:RNA polymerase sigma-70 factor (sigma-E family)